MAPASVVGWVRHINKAEADSDRHIELTSRRDAPPDSCVIVEIPLVDNEGHEGNYAQARNDLDAFLAAAGAHIDSQNDVSPPVRLRFIGTAFYDGFHHTHAGGASSLLMRPSVKCGRVATNSPLPRRPLP